MGQKFTKRKGKLKIDGESLDKIIEQLDYTLNGRERVSLIYDLLVEKVDGDTEILNNYLCEVLSESSGGKDYVEVNINTNSPLYEETGFGKKMELIVNYILYAPDFKEEEKSFVSSKTLERRAEKEIKQEYKDEIPKKSTKNFKKSMKLVNIPKKYFEKEGYELLKHYKHSIEWLNDKIYDIENELEQLVESSDEYKNLSKEIRKLKAIRSSQKTNELSTFESLQKPLKFKAPLPDSPSHDYSDFDFDNREHVFALLHFNRDKEYLSDTLDEIIIMLDDYIDKCEFDDFESDIIFNLSKNKSRSKIAKDFDTSYYNIDIQVNKIIDAIIEEYWRQYEDWYYTFKVRGKYNICKQCGEVKLDTRLNDDGYCVKCDIKICTKCNQTKHTSEFGKDSRKRDGLKSICKKCNAEIEKRRRLDKMMEELYKN